MQTLVVKPRKIAAAGSAAVSYALISGRGNGGKRPREAAERRRWESCDHFRLDVRAASPPRSPGSILGELPLVRLDNGGHSWVFAHLSHVAALGVAGRISSSSYIVGSSAALEEDCDAPALAEAIEEQAGRRFDWNRDAACTYDGLFDWDYAYDNFYAASIPAGEECILRPYDAAIAERVGGRWQRPAAAAAAAMAATATTGGRHE